MKTWNWDDLTSAIISHGLSIIEKKEIQHGKQAVLKDGSKATCYTSGKVVVQGRDCDEKQLLQLIVDGGTKSPIPSSDAEVGSVVAVKEPKVFIVYGHDTQS
ncbi:MAG TPA: hypothetical protein DIW81_22735, partial [Planctomycetaceae bacterium]|nr:hypothetical protein [Planctomycetaceae bacterium]